MPGYISVGARSSALREPGTFNVSEILIYEGKLRDDERRQVQRFLGAKYDLDIA